MAIPCQLLVHNRAGIIQAVASKTNRYLVIAERIFEIGEVGAGLLGRADRSTDFYSTWHYLPAFYREVSGMLASTANPSTGKIQVQPH